MSHYHCTLSQRIFNIYKSNLNRFLKQIRAISSRKRWGVSGRCVGQCQAAAEGAHLDETYQKENATLSPTVKCGDVPLIEYVESKIEEKNCTRAPKRILEMFAVKCALPLKRAVCYFWRLFSFYGFIWMKVKGLNCTI